MRPSGKHEESTLGLYADLTLSAARKLAVEKHVEVHKSNHPATGKHKHNAPAKLDAPPNRCRLP
ncbi:hypothetical protein [Paraburkholderia susongensis]|uniref:hypothetical protein n=1 Tax=Paraburkholderia susongensis TaxID=1515439 RepID=UPI003B82DF62